MADSAVAPTPAAPPAETSTILTKPPATPPAVDTPAVAKPEATAATTAPVIPDKYDLKLPDGSLLNAKAVERIAAYAKAQRLTNEQAQSVLDTEHKAVASFIDGQIGELEARATAWATEAKADKEFGGDAFPQNMEYAKRAVDKYATPGLKQILNETGLGNHPEMLRVFYRIGKAMKEDSVVVPGSQAGQRPSMAERFYGKTGE